MNTPFAAETTGVSTDVNEAPRSSGWRVLLVVFVICLVAGIYALGAQFGDRFKHAFDWDEQTGDLG